MPIIKQNDIIDVIYDKICGFEPEEAYKILELYQAKGLIPIEWIERKLAEHWYVDYDIRELLEDWDKENEKGN